MPIGKLEATQPPIPRTYVRSNLIQGPQKLRVIPQRLMLARAASLLVLPKIPKVHVRKAGAPGV